MLARVKRARALAALGAVLVLGLWEPQVAQADTAPPTGVVPTVSADGLPTWQVNGVVWSQVVVGNTVYATGSFTAARPPGVAAGGAGQVPSGNLFAYDITTGNPVSTFHHSLNAQGMTVSAAPDGSRVYVGGDFTTVDGIARQHVAAFDTATGALSTSFAPNVNGQVRAIAATASTVYVGGAFQSAAGVARNRLAGFAAANGAISATWKPVAPDGNVYALLVTPDASKVIAGGMFTTLNTTAVYGMGAVDAVTGATRPWAANATIHDAVNGAIDSLKTDGSSIYGSGWAYGTGASFEGTFSLNPSTGAINWLNDCHGDTYDVVPLGQVLYSVSHAHDCTAIGSFPDTSPRARWQHALAETLVPSGFNKGPDAYGWNYSGIPDTTILHWFPQLGIGSYTGQYQAAWSVSGNASYVVMGGEFPSVNGVAQQGLTRMATAALAPNRQGPTYTTAPSRPVPPTTATAGSGGTVSVTFGTAWDYDNQTLTYEVFRDGGTTPVYTTSIRSNFWTLPTAGFVDSGLPAGSSHTYQIRIRDPFANTLWSPRSNTVSTSAVVLKM